MRMISSWETLEKTFWTTRGISSAKHIAVFTNALISGELNNFVHESSFLNRGVSVRDLSDRLNLSRDEGEKWIVNLIRETKMGADAKIDLGKVRFPLLP